MVPISLVYDVVYRCAADSKLSSQRLTPVYTAVGLVSSTDFENLFFSELRILTTLYAHIGKIIRCSTNKQVDRIGTLPIVAMMANVQPFRYWSIVNFPRKTVSQRVLTIYVKLRISSVGFRPSPSPTSSAKQWMYLSPLVYISPKLVLGWTLTVNLDKSKTNTSVEGDGRHVATPLVARRIKEWQVGAVPTFR